MKSLKKALLAGVATVAFAGVAHAQPTPSAQLVVNPADAAIGSDFPEFPNNSVDISSGANAAALDGAFVFELDDNGAGGTPFGSGTAFVTITLTNAVFDESLTEMNVLVTAAGGMALPTACLGGGMAPTLPSGNITDGDAGDTTVEFEIPTIENCDTDAEGNLAFLLPIELLATADANFSVTVTSPAGATLFSETFDADDMTDGTQPLVDVQDPFDVEVFAPGDSMGPGAALSTTATELELGDEPPFTEFEGDATSAIFGGATITDEGTQNVLDQASDTPEIDEIDFTVTLGESASGIESIVIEDASGSTLVELEAGAGTEATTFTGELTGSDASGLVATGGSTDVFVRINAAEDDDAASIASQSVSFTVEVTSDDEVTATDSEAIAPITRAGSDSPTFVFVGIGNGPATNHIFRLTDVQPDPTIIVEIINLNAEAADGSDGISFVLPADEITLREGEVILSSLQLGAIAEDLGLIDFSSVDFVVRGDVSFTVEQSGVDFQRQQVTTGGGISDFGGDF